MKYSLKRFLQNIIYLARYNLKDINNNSLVYMKHRINFAAKLRNEIKNDFDILKPPRVKSAADTMKELVNTNKSIIRFGDGEYIIMGGGIPFQEYNKELADKLSEIILSDYDNLLIGLSGGHFHSPSPDANNIALEYDYSWVVENYNLIMKRTIPGKEYACSGISQVYAWDSNRKEETQKHYDMFKQIFSNKKIMLVCGDKILVNIKFNILEGSQVEYIYGPTKHAYRDIDRLRKELDDKVSGDEVLLFALGPAGKVLAYEMFLKGFRVLDIGHTIKDYDTYMRGVEMTDETIKDFFAPDE
ncbi:GT-D fold domain-containing glycosyltransferase [Helicobacter bilis]|uniref:GT-D fold domain-containing glycosyltransferase n=1 Tax=Helicobacter bilis TaxID=37372 RepID=UPI0026E9CE3E|nr:GT-D fold domain-containing glycosyltransferase [Helicobacter bilis]MDD7296890.1 GT-D fold domain-containing glycosyltransferase [Helicobacter bilis]MDY4399799.1 GT-D fold domain-containing glycosyltransferase [Helicobacter bilis]